MAGGLFARNTIISAEFFTFFNKIYFYVYNISKFISISINVSLWRVEAAVLLKKSSKYRPIVTQQSAINWEQQPTRTDKKQLKESTIGPSRRNEIKKNSRGINVAER